MNGDGGTIPGVEDPRVGSAPTKPVHLKKFGRLFYLISGHRLSAAFGNLWATRNESLREERVETYVHPSRGLVRRP